MATLTHRQAIHAYNALMQIIQLESVPAVPTGMAIRRGVRVLKDTVENIEEERKKIQGKWVEVDESGNRIPDELHPNGRAKTWKLKDSEAAQKEIDEFFDSNVELDWSIPESFFAGISLKPALLVDLGSLLVEESQK